MSLLLTQLGGGGDITGTAAGTQRAQTGAASGTITVSGSSANTQRSQTSAASGVITITGTGAGTERAQTSTATGEVIEEITGTAAGVQRAQTSTATGEIPIIPAGGVKKVRASRVKWIPWHGNQHVVMDGPSRLYAKPATSKASGWVGHIGGITHKAAPARGLAYGFVSDEVEELATVLSLIE